MSLPTRVNSFQVLQWNAGGLSQSKRTELLMTLREKEIDVFSIMGANLTCENPKYYSFKGYSLYVLPKLTNEAEERVQDFLNPSTFELVYNKEDPHTYLYHNGRRLTPEQLMRFADLYKFTKGAILKDPGSVHWQ
ncbi:hypothetical protein NPIL_383231, partial [Nephila pilipes]